jgi:hypothetical protein
VAFTPKQSKVVGTTTSAASLTATFELVPTLGNLLIAAANSDATLTMTSSGWTLAKSSIGEVGLYLWYKPAGPSESQEVKVTPAASELAVAIWGRLDESASEVATERTAESYSNTFAEAAEQKGKATKAAKATNLAAATKTLSAKGTQTCTVTFSGNVIRKVSALMVTFTGVREESEPKRAGGVTA